MASQDGFQSPSVLNRCLNALRKPRRLNICITILIAIETCREALTPLVRDQRRFQTR